MTASGLKLAEKRRTRGVNMLEKDVGKVSLKGGILEQGEMCISGWFLRSWYYRRRDDRYYLDPGCADPWQDDAEFSMFPAVVCGSVPVPVVARRCCKLLVSGCDCPSSIGCTPTLAVMGRLLMCGALEQRFSAFGESTSILRPSSHSIASVFRYLSFLLPFTNGCGSGSVTILGKEPNRTFAFRLTSGKMHSKDVVLLVLSLDGLFSFEAPRTD